MIEAVVWGAAVVPMFVLAAGIRRIPRRYAILAGLGFGLVYGTARLAIIGVDPGLQRLLDPGMLVLVGALGGSATTHWWERGDRERKRRSAAILDRPPAPVG